MNGETQLAELILVMLVSGTGMTVSDTPHS